MEGKDKKNKTREGLRKFKALFTLRYSATHYKDSVYNMIYRLDAMEAYNKKLVKKIAVKGISVIGTTATEGYVYLESLNLFRDKKPTANLGFEIKTAKGIRQVVRVVNKGDNLYPKSGELEEYKQGYVITEINGREDSVTFQNGKKLYVGDLEGHINESHLRRIQIRETILLHMIQPIRKGPLPKNWKRGRKWLYMSSYPVVFISIRLLGVTIRIGLSLFMRER